MGAASLVSFIAVLSVNLGLINLFPIPVLDGGHLLFFASRQFAGGRCLRGRRNTGSAPAWHCLPVCSFSQPGTT